MKWVQMKSWHYVREITETRGALTLCGRYTANLVWYTEPPVIGKSCETCLRIADRNA